MNSFSNTKTSEENFVFAFIKGLIVSLLISFALVVLFAFLIKWFNGLESYIYAGTMLIKLLAVSVGAAIAVKGENKGLLKGICFGLLYISLAFCVFSFLSNSFLFDLQTILDFIASGIAGGIVGVIKVNKQ